MKQGLSIEVFLGANSRTVNICIDENNLDIETVLEEFEKTEWGRKIVIKRQQRIEIVPNMVLLINDEPVQPWQYHNQHIKSDTKITFVPFIAGG